MNRPAMHHQTVDIVMWLERQALKEVHRLDKNTNSETAARLREAAAEIRKHRANNVAARFGQRLPPLQAKERRS